MDIYIIALLALIALFLIGEKLFFGKPNTPHDTNTHTRSNEEFARIEAELKNIQEDKQKYLVRGQELSKQNIALEEKNKATQVTIHDLQKKLAHFEEQKERLHKEHESSVTKLEQSRQALEDEKKRIRTEDEEEKTRQEQDRDRIWNEHEATTLRILKTICTKPDIDFIYYDNTNLPESFDGKFKPDFLVEFLGQYIIFDAKMSKSSDLQKYLKDQVKSTVKKIQESTNNTEIYPVVFFVVPTIEIAKLQEISFYENGYKFFIIPVEAVESIVQSYKKIKDYDLAESFDPKERENIVNVIAGFDQFVQQQNAYHILSTLQGLKISKNQEVLSEDIKQATVNLKQKIRLDNFKPTDIKKLMQNPEAQIQELKNLIEPKKPEISKQDIQDASDTLL